MRNSWAGVLWTNAIRLVVWYTLLTAVFRCPTSYSDLTASSPRICRPILDARSRCEPYVKPYYDTYVASYVAISRPYYDTVQSKIYEPAMAKLRATYEIYGASHLARIKEYGYGEWETSVKPGYEKARENIGVYYANSLAPQISHVADMIQPHVADAQREFVHMYRAKAVLIYGKCRRTTKDIYNQCHRFTSDILLPYARRAATLVLTSVRRRIWPPLTVLYGNNVEPQLVRIRARLARYRENRKHELATNKIQSTLNMPVDPLSSTTSSSFPSMESPNADHRVGVSLSSSASITSTQVATAAPGTHKLMSRIEQIISSQISSQAHGVGKALVTQLEMTISTALDKLESTIHRTFAKFPAEASKEEVEVAQENMFALIRLAGNDIRARAQQLQSWKKKYDAETVALVRAAFESSTEPFNSILDPGLQANGMRWASMDGGTDRDWSEDQAFEKAFEEWRANAGAATQRHRGLSAATQEGNAIESRGMMIAEDAARQLNYLKEVVKQQIRPAERSDSLGSGHLSAEVPKLGHKMQEDASISSSQSSIELKSAESVMSLISEEVSAAGQSGLSAMAMAIEKIESLTGVQRDLVQRTSGEVDFDLVAVSDSSLPSGSYDEEKSAPKMGTDITRGHSVLSALKTKKAPTRTSIKGSFPPPADIPVETGGAISNFADSANTIREDIASPDAGPPPRGTLAPNLGSCSTGQQDIVDDAKLSSSRSLQSAVSAAGSQYATLTAALQHSSAGSETA